MTLDRLAWFVGEIARPFATISTAAGATASMVIVAVRVENGNDGAILLGAIGVIVLGVFGVKGAEAIMKSTNDRKVEVAKVQATTP
jgi:hypothetical protein